MTTTHAFEERTDDRFDGLSRRRMHVTNRGQILFLARLSSLGDMCDGGLQHQ